MRTKRNYYKSFRTQSVSTNDQFEENQNCISFYITFLFRKTAVDHEAEVTLDHEVEVIHVAALEAVLEAQEEDDQSQVLVVEKGSVANYILYFRSFFQLEI